MSLASIFSRGPGTPRLSDLAITDDDLYNVLSTSRRRHVIEIIAEHGELTTREMADIIAGRENNKDAEDVEPDERKRVYVPLYQSHLDKLADNGIIEYDDRGGNIKATDQAYALRDAMAVIADAWGEDL